MLDNVNSPGMPANEAGPPLGVRGDKIAELASAGRRAASPVGSAANTEQESALPQFDHHNIPSGDRLRTRSR
jgi:hypothetical protein